MLSASGIHPRWVVYRTGPDGTCVHCIQAQHQNGECTRAHTCLASLHTFFPSNARYGLYDSSHFFPSPSTHFPLDAAVFTPVLYLLCVFFPKRNPSDMHRYQSNKWRTCHNGAEQSHAEYVVVMIAVTSAREKRRVIFFPFSFFLPFFLSSFAGCSLLVVRDANALRLCLI